MFNGREGVSQVEIFLKPKHNEDYLEEQRKALKEREVDGCTFKPETLDYKGAGQRQSTHGDKNIDLYASKPKGWFKDKPIKSTDEVIFDACKEDCTFRPKINDGSTMQQAEETNIQQVKGLDKVMDRM